MTVRPSGPGWSPVRQSVELPAGVTRELLPLTAEDGAAFDGVLYQRPDRAPRVALVLMHPVASFLHHYAAIPLAARGFAVLALNSRFVSSESELIVEEVALDLAAGVAHLRERGFERVVLMGNSAGGGLVAFYQAQAEHPTVRATPGGRPPDLTAARLPQADALVILNAHRGRAQLLTAWLDPAVTDEQDPLATDPELDLFAPGRTPPYDPAYVERYRAAQEARNHRITAWVHERLARLEAARVPDQAFTVHRTAADPRFLDLTLDPSEREPGASAGSDLRAANYAPAGLARHASLHSWLSQWSLADSHVAAEANVARVSVPLLFLQGTADQRIFPSDVRAVFDAARVDDKRLSWIPGGSHHFLDQPADRRMVVDLVEDWLAGRGMPARR
ncbi:MAG TPA: alpha/beta hydrolase [Candidatus Dormibacteraeota bacterium]